jgi:hypothetical protein
MTISTRLAKLRFIAQELELAFLIARALPDDHYRRVLARRVIIRAKDFIDHARKLKRPLQRSGVDTRDLHIRKEVYAASFGEHFPVLRDRLGAHMQDLELVNRLQLWNDIEVTKLSYLVDGAKEIYVHSLGRLALPQYDRYASFPELSDDEFLRAFDALSVALSQAPRVRMAVDAVAGTRPNTVVLLNEHAAHIRAKQIVSLIEWISLENRLLQALPRFPNAFRVLKSQFVTDIVSMADCISTRPVVSGSKQEMKGLDLLLADEGETAAYLAAFKRVFRFSDALEPLRSVRDKIGGHLDDDPTSSLPTLLTALDALGALDAYRFFDKLRATFEATCREVVWLGSYLHHDRPLPGVTSTRGGLEFIRSFDSAISVPEPEPGCGAPDDTSSTAAAHLDAWIDSSEEAEDARLYFWHAFAQAPVVERCDRSELKSELKDAHLLLLRRFTEAAPDHKRRILDLIVGCRSGYPRELAELVLRFIPHISDFGEHSLMAAVFDVLSRLPLDQDEPVRSVLANGARSTASEAATAAAVGLFRFLARHKSGPAIANPPQRTIFESQVAPLLMGMSSRDRLLVLLRCASSYTDGTVGSNDVLSDYAALQTAIISEVTPLLDESDHELVQRTVQAHDFVSLSVLIADRLNRQGRSVDADLLLKSVATGAVGMTLDFQVRGTSLANYAISLLRTGRGEEAKEIAAHAARTYPHDVRLKIHCVRILADAGVPSDECLEMIAYVRRMYVLSARDEDLVRDAERELRELSL